MTSVMIHRMMASVEVDALDSLKAYHKCRKKVACTGAEGCAGFGQSHVTRLGYEFSAYVSSIIAHLISNYVHHR